MILTGLCRLGKDAELRSTTQGEQVATLALAFNYGRKGQDGKRPTCWVEAALWGKRAEALVEYLLKGTTLDVVLEDPHVTTYTKTDGTVVPKLVAKVANLEFASSPERAPAATPPPAPRPAPAPRAAAPAPAARTTSTGFDDMDDDIPF